MTHELLEAPRAEPDFDAFDDMAAFAVAHADELAALDRAAAERRVAEGVVA